MTKQAKKELSEAELIKKLKAERDRSLANDLLRKIGWRGLQGLGIGAGVGGVLGIAPGAAYGAMLGSNIPDVGMGLGAGAGAVGGVLGGAVGGGYYGTGIGALAGGLESLLTYNNRKQRAIDRLKELGVKDNVVN